MDDIKLNNGEHPLILVSTDVLLSGLMTISPVSPVDSLHILAERNRMDDPIGNYSEIFRCPRYQVCTWIQFGLV
jgi:hypothetical protein